MSNIEDFFNPKPIEIPCEIPSNIFEVFKDIAATDEIKQKFKDVCVFMAMNKLQMMSLKGENVSFNLEMVVDESAKEAADDREED